MVTEFYIGQELEWLHGLHSHRIGKVVLIEGDRVKIEGLTKSYFISKTALLRKVNAVYPDGAGIFG